MFKNKIENIKISIDTYYIFDWLRVLELSGALSKVLSRVLGGQGGLGESELRLVFSKTDSSRSSTS